MVVTFVLRLLDERLAQGELVGEAEHVSSGRCVAVTSTQELVVFAREAAVDVDELRSGEVSPPPSGVTPGF